TSETTPLSVIGFLSSNLARISWCASTVAAVAKVTASSAEANTRANLGLMLRVLLLPGDAEGAGAALALPRADDRAVRKTDVFVLAGDGVSNGGPRLVLAVGLEMHDPSFRFQGRVLDHHVVGAGIDGAADVLAVPAEHEEHVIAVNGVARPRA